MSRTRIVCDLHKVVLAVCGCSHPAVTTLPVTFIPIEDVEKENKTAESTEVLNVTVGSGKYPITQDQYGCKCLRPTPETDALFAPMWVKDGPPTDEDLHDATKSHRRLERQRNEARQAFAIATDQLVQVQSELRQVREENARLRAELEINTQEIDSYGEPGSNFRICTYCHAESGAGLLDKGIPHEETCILYTKP